MTYIIVSWMDTTGYADIAIVFDKDEPMLFVMKSKAEEYANTELNGEYSIVEV